MQELLDFALRHADEADHADAQLLRRNVLLEIYEDETRDNDEKLAALSNAIGVLDDLVTGQPDDPRCNDWRLMLGKDLVYRQAEPYYMNILLKTPTAEDRRALLAITTKAADVFDALKTSVTEEKDRIESLGPEKFNDTVIGRLRKLDELRLAGEYFGAWAVFYRALAMDPADAQRAALLKEVLAFLVEQSNYVDRPHGETGVQCESLVLAGMASRLLGEYPTADNYLGRAIEVAETVEMPEARAAVAWVVVLARLEQIKAARDRGDGNAAVAGIERFRTWMAAAAADNLGAQLAIALLEMDLYRRQAETAAGRGDSAEHARLMTRARRPLLALAEAKPAYRDAVYETVYQTLRHTTDVTGLDPFEQTICLAGLIRDATQIKRRIETLDNGVQAESTDDIRKEAERLKLEMAKTFDRAIEVADALLASTDALAVRFRPETLFNRAVCLYERGKLLDSARTFMAVADEHADFDRAETAAGHAVDIAAQLYQDEAMQQHQAVRETFLGTLRVLTQRYPDTDRARYAQFFLANVLDRLGRHADAAVEYAKVDGAHPKAIDARYYRLLCLQRRLDELEQADPDEAVLIEQVRGIIAESKKVTAAATRLKNELAAAQPQTPEVRSRLGEVNYFAGDAELIAATVSCLPAIHDYAGALKLLEDFSKRYPGHRDLIGSALRIRILAYQGLRRFDEAAGIVDAFLDGAPEQASDVIVSLLSGVRDGVTKARDRGDEAAAAIRAGELRSLAQRLWTWAQKHATTLEVDEKLAIKSMVADAHLLGGDVEEALKLFDECVAEDAARWPDGKAVHGPSLFGKAEALRRLKRYKEAINLYNEVWRRTEERSTLWWRTLVRSLDCHTQVGTPPARILNSIAQHRRGDPEMGGSRIRAEFDRLENINRKRSISGGS